MLFFHFTITCFANVNSLKLFFFWDLLLPTYSKPQTTLKGAAAGNFGSVECSFKFPGNVAVEESIVNAPLV
jgi:hypothetical protein